MFFDDVFYLLDALFDVSNNYNDLNNKVEDHNLNSLVNYIDIRSCIFKFPKDGNARDYTENVMNNVLEQYTKQFLDLDLSTKNKFIDSLDVSYDYAINDYRSCYGNVVIEAGDFTDCVIRGIIIRHDKLENDKSLIESFKNQMINLLEKK